MYKATLIALLFILMSSCYHIERNCADFKKGTFEFSYIQDGIEKTGTFKRTEKYNIDYYDSKVDSASVRWINDCEFILEKINPDSNSEAKAIHMKILTTTSNSYTFEYKYAAKDPYKPLKVFKGEAKKTD